MMRVMVVAGTRPNFMKVAPILRTLVGRGHEALELHTAQHLDVQVSDASFHDLELPKPGLYRARSGSSGSE